MSRDERILQRKLSCQIRRIDGFIETVDSIIEAGETVRLEIMGEELKEIKEKIEKLYDELFSLDEVDIDKESEAYDSSMNKIGSLRANCNDSHVLLATAGIKIKNGLGKLCTCRALLDSGSQVTMITKGCCERLGLVQRKSDRMIIGVGNTPVQHSSSTVSVTFFPLNNSEEFSVEAVVTFRTYPVAITADIEKMYRQIRIHPEDADYQRILWRPSPEEPVVDYRLLTVTYGTTSAPFLAMRTLQQLAEDEGQNYPEASRVTLNDFYVDDLLTGAQTIAETKELIDQLKDLMKKGGFHLRKWNSNCHEIVSHVEEMNEEKKINLEKGAISKILGIVWDHVQDTFRVNITLPEEVVTKRDLLSNIARIFDPIGFLSPTTVALKIIMQELWRDSQISLSWIKSDPKRWKTFIHNRVVKIQQLSDRNSWRHVSGKDNPADCASRGIMPAALSGHTLWWQGPTWLKDNNFVQNQDNCYGREYHEEEKVALACQSRVSVCPEIVTKYSTFIKTRRIIAWCLRFITNCRVSLKKREIGTLSKKELESAVIRIIGWIQEDEFGEEMQDLRNMVQGLRNSFWSRWTREYINSLQQRNKWRLSQDNLKPNQLVLIKEDNLPPLQWRLARILEVYPGSDQKTLCDLIPCEKNLLFKDKSLTDAQTPFNIFREGVGQCDPLFDGEIGVVQFLLMALHAFIFCGNTFPTHSEGRSCPEVLLYVAGGRSSTSKGLPCRAKYSVVSPEPQRTKFAESRSDDIKAVGVPFTSAVFYTMPHYLFDLHLFERHLLSNFSSLSETTSLSFTFMIDTVSLIFASFCDIISMTFTSLSDTTSLSLTSLNYTTLSDISSLSFISLSEPSFFNFTSLDGTNSQSFISLNAFISLSFISLKDAAFLNFTISIQTTPFI
ncbi:hypothetical protein LAZ67_X004563 [Cordylochernes scorpioides]|uniref:DUF5641 domain-containing protein n=1 Tax=Cordylochernes scorpioides TaxID=51811 RepID=A0ABY6LZ64_9ARAC|nr:hypothetical protein LAZ67_X004563 [Cordylochernes scorpioides]